MHYECINFINQIETILKPFNDGIKVQRQSRAPTPGFNLLTQEVYFPVALYSSMADPDNLLMCKLTFLPSIARLT